MAPSAIEQPPPLSLKPQFLVDTGLGEHENEFYRSFSTGYSINEAPGHTKRPIRMIIVGAGAAGLQIAYKAERQLENVTFNIYEKNHDIGGTSVLDLPSFKLFLRSVLQVITLTYCSWLENRYPGCTCDIPSHSYQWTFARNSEWSSYYSSSKEIWEYMKKWAVENNLEKYVSLNHRVEEARWNQDEGLWEVSVMRPDGSVFVDRAEILASCHGILKSVSLPPG